MPILEFLNHAEINENATSATLVTANGAEQQVPLQALKECFLLFAVDGKPLKDDGPVHFLYRDGSNRENPIKGVEKLSLIEGKGWLHMDCSQPFCIFTGDEPN